MNANTDTTAAAQASMHCIIPQNLQLLSMRHLSDLYSAMMTIRETAFGLANQPRFSSDSGKYEANAAGDELETLCDHLGEYVQAIVDVAAATEPHDPEEVRQRAFLLLRHEAECRDSLPNITVLAAEMMKALSEAEFLASHKGGKK